MKDDYSATIVERAKLKHVSHTSTYGSLLDSSVYSTTMRESRGKRGGGRSLRNTGHLHWTCISRHFFLYK